MSLAEQRAAPPIPTPCIGVCQLNEAIGLCRGCGRTGEELAAWQAADASYKLRVWDALPERRAREGLSTYRLPWSAEEIAAFIERSLRRRWGRWVLGLDGASISFAIAADEEADILSRPDAIIAVTGGGAFRLVKHAKAIAVAFGASGGTGPEAIGLMLPRGRVDLRRGDCLVNAGADAAAVVTGANAQLYDLGIAHGAAARFCLRTADPVLAAALDAAQGRNWRDVLGTIGPLLDAARPHYVAETGIGRAEFFAPAAPHRDLCERGPLIADREEELRAPLTRPPSGALPRVMSLYGDRQAYAAGRGLPPGESRAHSPSLLAGEGGASAPGEGGSANFVEVSATNCAAGAELRRDAASFPELPHVWSLPAVFAPCALFYPHVRKPVGAFLDGHF
jgi:predicted Fe-S protein YdhL (DUF1289 family)